MHINRIEIGNFRKLGSVRVDFADKTTLLVGANNSGKTSAMLALRRFLVDPTEFTINDFTLSNWAKLDALGDKWEHSRATPEESALDLREVLPSLDVWLEVPVKEIHYIQHLLPSLEWNGELVGVRLTYEPKDAQSLEGEYREARSAAREILLGSENGTTESGLAGDVGGDAGTSTFTVWPRSMVDFLTRRLRATFQLRAYLLDPEKLASPINGTAQRQPLPEGSEALDRDPFEDLIQIDDVGAQRGLGLGRDPDTSQDGLGNSARGRNGTQLSRKLRSYFNQHLNPVAAPEPKDIDALKSIFEAQEAFGRRLAISFEPAIKELQDVGYPGLSDPKLSIVANINPVDSISHPSAVQYSVPPHDQGGRYQLPEDSNGLGYQNLVSIVFDLMSFRDRWMKVGKASRSGDSEASRIRPLHLTLVEEPEAHLHAPVQQVFVRHAYSVLRKHDRLGDDSNLRSQLVISTHSSHIAHEANFSTLRYFRRQATCAEGAVPLSTVINLSEIFGTETETARFVRRYLKATHCDLFFADGAVLIEGPAERIVLPHFVREHKKYQQLSKSYIAWLEIGGSHAHRLKALLEHLGLPTLIITDVDVMAANSEAKATPRLGESLRTRNSTLKSWIPARTSYDELMNIGDDALVQKDGNGGSIRVAYQQPVEVEFRNKKNKALANTFEDALLYENLVIFEKATGDGLIKKFSELLTNSNDLDAVTQGLTGMLDSREKAQLALDILFHDDLQQLLLPAYIQRGLGWLTTSLKETDSITADVGEVV